MYGSNAPLPRRFHNRRYFFRGSDAHPARRARRRRACGQDGSRLSPRAMRLLFLGDVMGRTGRTAIASELPRLRRDWRLDFVVVNGENATGGMGLSAAHAKLLLDAGADCLTLGDHAFDQRDMLAFIEQEPRDPAAAQLRPQPRRGGARASSTRPAGGGSSSPRCWAGCS